MAGHSKWKQIKHKKALTDAKRGKAFSKMARMITVVVKEKGPDLDINSKLRTAVEKARAQGMPSANIERAISRGAGATGEASLEEVFYEAYGPGGSAFLIEGITDSKNRTTSEIKHLLSDGGGRLAEKGSVEWLFDKVFIIEFPLGGVSGVGKEKLTNTEALELALIDAGAADIRFEDTTGSISTDLSAAENIKKALANNGITPSAEYSDYVPKNPLSVADEETKRKIVTLYEAFDDHDDIQNVYTNTEL